MDLAEQARVARDRERQIRQMPEERHARRPVFLEQTSDRARKHFNLIRMSMIRGYASERRHKKVLQ
jgi:hypothetical protein